MRRVFQLVPFLEPGDAIGNHARRFAMALGPAHAGYIVERASGEQARTATPFTRAEVDPGDVLVYHVAHSSRLGDWLAGLLRLEDEPLSKQEIAEALKLVLRYGLEDLFVPDWGAAVLVDREGESDETLQAVEFANLQLLEFRHIDNRLDDNLGTAYQRIHRVAHARLPLWRGSDRALRALGEMKVETTIVCNANRISS